MRGTIAGVGARFRPRYRVAFDGKWREDFDDEGEAVAWAKEVGDTGRITFVVWWRPLHRELIAIFPEKHREMGEDMWRHGFSRGWGAGGF